MEATRRLRVYRASKALIPAAFGVLHIPTFCSFYEIIQDLPET